MQALAKSVSVGARIAGASVSAESSGKARSQVAAVRAGSKLPASCASVSEFTRNAVVSKVPAGSSRRSGHRAVVSMSKNTAAAGYAAALVELGKATGTLDALHKDLESLGNLLNNQELSDFLANPVVVDIKKKQILKTLSTDGKFSTHTTSFLNLLVDKRRINIIQEIALAFEELYCEVTDTQVAVVTSAVKLENSQQALIAKKLQSMTGAKNIKLKNIVDSSLIAGFVVKFGKDGSNEIDMSVKGQLDRLAAQFEYAEKAASTA